MRKEALIGLSVLLVAVSGSATVLDSFGVISGEASVEPAVQLTEIHYNPDGEDSNESIEVYNPGSQSIDISDWAIDYESISTVKDISEDKAVVPPGEHAVITQDQDYTSERVYHVSSLGLDNGGDTVSLVYSDKETVIQSKDYGKNDECIEGYSIQRIGDFDSNWDCDSPTLGEENEVSASG